LLQESEGITVGKPKERNKAGGTDTYKSVPRAEPNPNGNRAERRAAERQGKKEGR
jgi:hypothetical protein